MEALVLAERVKRQVAGTAHHVIKLVVLIGWRIGMGLGTKLL